MDLMGIYYNMPVGIQNLMCSIEGLRVKNRKYGNLQKSLLGQYLERGSWSYAQLTAFRDKELQRMVEHCYLHVPYYCEIFDSLGIDYKQIKCLDDLKVLPLLNKQLVKENANKLMADNYDANDVMKMHTSGTTGSALQFSYTKTAYAHQWAEDERYTREIGVDLASWKAYFGGRSIVPREGNKLRGPVYRINYPMREVLFSAWHINPENFPSYIEGLERYKPKMWHGYASSIEMLAQFCIDSGTRLSYVPEIIFLSSENASEGLLNKVQKAFGVKPVQGYAQTEEVATFREYPNEGMYIVEDLSAVELLPADDGMYRVVGTTLTNYAMPFLRYDTNDLVEYELTERGRRITRIEGRAEDNIVVKDGGIIRRLDYLFKDQVNVADACIIQRSMDVVEFQIVKGANYSVDDENMLRRDIEDYFDNRIGYTIQYVDSIPKGKNGKRKFIVSEVR